MVRCLPSTGVSAAGEITSIYATPLGTISLTWTRSSLGIFLLADLRLTHNDNINAIPDHLQFRLRPYLTWNRKGSKRHHFTSAAGRRRTVEIAWDLSLAKFSRARGPEPTGGFLISVAVDGEICLVVGDRGEAGSGSGPGGPIWQRERVRFGGEMWYATKGWFEGKEMEISIWVDVEGEEMRVGIEGEVVLEVRRLCWKFRGREGVGLKGGGRIEVAWDLYDWFFQGKGEAVFVLRFEKGRSGGCFWKRDQWSDDSSSSGSWSGSEEEELEEAEMGREGGFTLLVCGRRKG